MGKSGMFLTAALNVSILIFSVYIFLFENVPRETFSFYRPNRTSKTEMSLGETPGILPA